MKIEEEKAVLTFDVVDVAVQARELYGKEGAELIGGRPLADHEYRYQVTVSRPGSERVISLPVGWSGTAEELIKQVLR